MSKISGHKRIALLFLLLGVTLAAVFVWHSKLFATDDAGSSSFLLARASDPQMVAPNFELEDLNGAKVRLEQFKGKEPVLLYFWATWCPSCNAVKPQVIEMRNDTSQDELEILGINVAANDPLERVKKFQKAHPVPFPILYDADQKVSRMYHVRGIPLFVLIDKAGKIVYLDNEPPTNIKKYLGQ